MIKYEATRIYAPTAMSGYRQTEQEFDTMEAAKAYVEEHTSGKVITWAVYPNNPGCLPAMRYSSCALTVFENGEWRGINIHE